MAREKSKFCDIVKRIEQANFPVDPASLTGPDLTRFNISAVGARILARFYDNLATLDDPSFPPSIDLTIDEDIKDIQALIQDLGSLQSSILNVLQELSTVELPEIMLDEAEFASLGIPELDLCEVERILGEGS